MSRMIRFILAAELLCSGCKTPESAVKNVENPPQDDTSKPGDNATGAPNEEADLLSRWFDFTDNFSPDREKATVEVNPAGNAVLRAVGCDLARTNAAAIAKFYAKETQLSSIQFRAMSTGPWCEAIIDPILSDDQMRLLNRSLSDGADTNCWGAALHARHVVPEWMNANEYQWRYFLSSPQCTYLPPTEPAQPGDLISIQLNGPDGVNEIHGAAYISDNLWLTKNGGSRFAISSPTDIVGVYGAGTPWRCFDTRNASEGCSIYISYHRCQSFEQFTKDTQSFSGKIKQLYQDLETLLVNSDRLNSEQYKIGEISLGEAYQENAPFVWGRTFEEADIGDSQQKLDDFFALPQKAADGTPNYIVREPTHYKIASLPKAYKSFMRSKFPNSPCSSLNDDLAFEVCFWKAEGDEGISEAKRDYVKEKINQAKELIKISWNDYKNGSNKKLARDQMHLLLGLIYRFRSFGDAVSSWSDQSIDEFNTNLLPPGLDPLTVFLTPQTTPPRPTLTPLRIIEACKKCRLYISHMPQEQSSQVLGALNQAFTSRGLHLKVAPNELQHLGGTHWVIRTKTTDNLKVSEGEIASSIQDAGGTLKLLAPWD